MRQLFFFFLLLLTPVQSFGQTPTDAQADAEAAVAMCERSLSAERMTQRRMDNGDEGYREGDLEAAREITDVDCERAVQLNSAVNRQDLRNRLRNVQELIEEVRTESEEGTS